MFHHHLLIWKLNNISKALILIASTSKHTYKELYINKDICEGKSELCCFTVIYIQLNDNIKNKNKGWR
ncbi:hypothetical protein C9J41_04055 [Photobacterium sp. GB-50]|nr:hypothetical protein C9J41_04055 [Photobacterium sp. GB-50]